MSARIRAVLIRMGYHSKPGFIVIGTQKGGTSAIHNYLARHPGIIAASKKEIHFFDTDESLNRGYSWYHQHFRLPSRLGESGITFEATPTYIYYPMTAERICAYDPQIKQ